MRGSSFSWSRIARGRRPDFLRTVEISVITERSSRGFCRSSSSGSSFSPGRYVGTGRVIENARRAGQATAPVASIRRTEAARAFRLMRNVPARRNLIGITAQRIRREYEGTASVADRLALVHDGVGHKVSLTFLCGSAVARRLHFKHTCIAPAERHQLRMGSLFHQSCRLRAPRCGLPCARWRSGVRSAAPSCPW